jgi:CubicO group peptidase (beta-lactamase class C family)
MTRYFPARGSWKRRTPEAAGFDAAGLHTAIEHARSTEIDWPIDVGEMVGRNDPPPYDGILGPSKPRGPAGGVVIRHGYLVAEWGEPDRVDMTFSATKSYLSTVIGIARDRGMLSSMEELVHERIDDGGFDSAHNAAITWKHLLQQTSEWQGTLFERPDSVDHNRAVAGAESTGIKGVERPLQTPGSFWEYNDVRVNRTALCALRIWREPLPDVLRREVMDPIGASDSWEWHGYRNSRVEIDGAQIQSVSGGAHWGGGLWISALDHARFGYLMLNGGEWEGRRLISEEWIDEAMRPCAVNDQYGYMWWLNTGQQLYDAPPTSFAAHGAGGNLVFIDPADDLVVVTRWAGDGAGVVNRVVAALI